MNKLEQKIYNLVKAKPWLKFFIRNAYQAFFDLIPKKNELSINEITFKQNYFFGFHDKSPFSFDCTNILANRLVLNNLNMPKENDMLEVGYFKFERNRMTDYIKIGESFAWNYHKGCRLQWIDNERMIYNTAINKALCSKIFNISSSFEKVIDYPIDTVSEDGKWATSFSCERLEKLMPGYGYIYKDEGYLDDNAPKNTGLFIIDLEKNQRQLLVSIHDLCKSVSQIPNIESYKHYITHSEFSKDGNFISFLHRWIKDDIRDRKTRLVIYDFNKNEFFSLPTQGMVSHYVWNNNNQILAYCNIDGIDCHAIFNIPDIFKYEKIVPYILNSDGHQSFIDNFSFVTDTYPDKFRMSKLYKANIKTDSVLLLASIYSPKKYQTKSFNNHIACDLHPRVSPDGKFVSFDAIRQGNRSLCIMKL